MNLTKPKRRSEKQVYTRKLPLLVDVVDETNLHRQILFGTDVGYMADHDPADEYRLMAEAGLDFRAILASLTTTPARLLGEEAESGALIVGRAGDLVVVEGRPDRGIEALGDVRATVRDGTVVFQSLPR